MIPIVKFKELGLIRYEVLYGMCQIIIKKLLSKLFLFLWKI